MSVATLMTAEQFLRMPSDGNRYELVAGELRKRSPPSFDHGVVVSRLDGLLGDYVREHDLGIVAAGDPGFILARDPDTVRGPDVTFVRKERLAENPARGGFWPGAPDLVAEVVSPGDTRREVQEKAEAWVEAGVRLVWLVNPMRRTVTVYRPGGDVQILSEGDSLDGLDVVPGFCCRVADLFRVR